MSAKHPNPNGAAGSFAAQDMIHPVALAQKLAIPPGVVIGRLQREKLLDYNVGQHLRRRFVLVGDGPES